MSTPGGGFLGTLGLVGFAIGLGVTFAAFPRVHGATWAWLQAYVLGGYGPDVLHWAPTFWAFVVALGLYALTRAALFLLISLGGLVLTLALIFRRWRN